MTRAEAIQTALEREKHLFSPKMTSRERLRVSRLVAARAAVYYETLERWATLIRLSVAVNAAIETDKVFEEDWLDLLHVV